MKVLVHLNHGVDRSVLYNFGRNLTPKEFKKLLKKSGVDEMINVLTAYAGLSDSVRTVEITKAQEIKKVCEEADATIDQGKRSVAFA